MKTIIIGASGLVGSNILNELLANSWQAKGTYFSYPAANTVFYDTLQPSNPDNFSIQEFNPDVIIHCGALTHVDYCETNKEESYQKTVESTRNLVSVAQSVQAKLVYISTDYVFDGKAGPYTEEHTPNPISVYGAHKLEAEQLVQNNSINSLIIRVAKVFGHEEREKNFVARMAKTIEETGEIKWNGFTDQYTTAICAADIAKAIFLLLNDKKSGIYHLGYGEYFNAYEMVNKIVSMYKHCKAEVNPITKLDFQQAAARPEKGGLLNSKFVSEYPNFDFTTIEEYIEQRKKL